MEEPSDNATIKTFRNVLLAIAKRKRSRVENLLPLRDLAMGKIVSYDVGIESSTLLPHLSPCLKMEILERMQAKAIEREKKLTMPVVKDLIFRMLTSLLDASTKKFDFVVFSTYHKLDKQRDLDTWDLLARKCPNLEQISDSRKHSWPNQWQPDRVVKGVGKFKLQDVKNFLLQLPKLQHMLLEQYECDEVDMAWIAEHFPNLITLGVSFVIVTPFLLANLCNLQRLEVVLVSWDMFGEVNRKLSEADRAMQRYYCEHFGLESVKKFPRLRVFSIHPDLFMSVYPLNDDDLFTQDPGQPLPLERITTGRFLNFGHLPNLTHVKFVGRLTGNPAPCTLLTNLRVLEIEDDSGSLIYQILSLCGKQLEELKLIIEVYRVEDPIDVCDIFLLCPRLHKLDYIFGTHITELKPFNNQLDASHFQNLKEFYLHWRLGYAYASRLMALVLTAPLLERFTMSKSFTMTPEVCTQLHRPLIEGEILQQLKKFKFGSHREQPAELLTFLLLLPVHAPRLEKMECFGAHRSFLKQIQESPMQALNAIDHFEYTDTRIRHYLRDYEDDSDDLEML
ncbi:uncharacterized protein LOC132194698 [Neocloeon triangulifer]|uniref:uncharacterized protein LOC132194698 n=1 Tax=Neocloeon triangulifer TaxID=2078957 RepID=UPI00286FA7F5|nr:uncharacterized protein LOC132194698 [Neocloeon triangulifer]